MEALPAELQSSFPSVEQFEAELAKSDAGEAQEE